MPEFEYGPVEVLLISFDGERPGPAVVAAILGLIESGTATLLDLTFVTRALDGTVDVLEVEELEDDLGFAGLELTEIGLTAEEDIEGLALDIEPGTSAAVLVVEHTWAREFASALFLAGGRVVRSERIPAPVVNELLAAAL